MVDYLGDKRHLPKIKSRDADELQRDVEQCRCKSCQHYDFYFCRSLQIRCGPDGTCMDIPHYVTKSNYVSV